MRSLRLLEILANPGPDAAVQLLDRWYGLKPGDGIPAEVLATTEMPELLRDFYARAGRRFAGGQNEFLTPDAPQRIALWEVEQRQGDKLIFYVENVHVWEWATSIDGDDPPVWYRTPGSEEWHEERSPLSTFLLQAVLLNLSLYQDPVGVWQDSVPADELDRLRSALVEVPGGPFGPWDLRFFAGDDIVAQTDPNSWAYVAASCGEALSALPIDLSGWQVDDWPSDGEATHDVGWAPLQIMTEPRPYPDHD